MFFKSYFHVNFLIFDVGHACRNRGPTIPIQSAAVNGGDLHASLDHSKWLQDAGSCETTYSAFDESDTTTLDQTFTFIN
jgi:hypothetical protein